MKPIWSEIWGEKGAQNNLEPCTNKPLRLFDLIELNGYDGKHGTHSEETFRLQVDLLIAQFKPIAGKGSRALEVGCGAGAFLKVLEEAYELDVGGTDFSKSLLGHAKNSLKAPLGLYHADALDDVGMRNLDFVFSHGVFHYFPSEDYALRVLNTMSSFLAQNRSAGLAVMDVRDQGKAEDYFLFRTESLDRQVWTNVGHRLFSKEFFLESLRRLGFQTIQIVDSQITSYGNSPYSFNVFALRS